MTECIQCKSRLENLICIQNITMVFVCTPRERSLDFKEQSFRIIGEFYTCPNCNAVLTLNENEAYELFRRSEEV